MEENKSTKLILVISIIALIAIVGVVVAFVFIGGDEETNTGTVQNTGNGNKNNQTTNLDNTQTGLDIALSEDMFIKSVKYTNADMEAEESYSSSVVIDLNNGSPKCANSSVRIDGTTVTILAGGKYTVTGTMDEGQIIVSPAVSDENNVKIMFDGVSISNSKKAPFVSTAEGKTIITLKKGTQNIINDLRAANPENSSDSSASTKAETEEDNDAAIWCANDLSINGLGSLKVTANYDNGIKSKDDLVISNGVIEVDAAQNVLAGNDSVAIKAGTFTLKGGNNGIRCKTNDDITKGYIVIDGGTFDIQVTGSAIKSEFTVIINSGKFNISAGNDAVHGEYGVQVNNGSVIAPKCEEGIEGAYIVINDGEVDITSSDDGINASNSIGETTDSNNDNNFDMNMFNPDNAKPGGMKPGDATGENPGMQKPNRGQRPDGEMPSGEVPNGEMPSAEVPDGEMPSTEVPNGEMPSTEVPNGEMPQMPDGAARGGKGNKGGMGGMDVEDASLIIDGGKIRINAGGDGLDSNGDITINGGEVYVNGPTNNGNCAIDSGKEILINSGTAIIVGSSGMLEAPSTNGKQNTIVATFNSLDAGSVISVKDEAGNEIMSYESPKAFSSLIYSSDKLETGKTYTVESGETELATFTISSTVASSGNMMGGFGGMGGFMR